MKLLVIGFGYVGSYLVERFLREGHEIVICDPKIMEVPEGVRLLACRYQELPDVELAGVDRILWFAGHSSVGLSISDPDGALVNNCLDLLTLARRKASTTRLIYASTASLYSTAQQPGDPPPAPVPEERTLLNPINPYDCSKIAFDTLASCFAQNLTGLRMGTVSGWSPHLRRELVFNAMNISAIETGSLNVSNAYASRSILFLDDLADLISALIRANEPVPRIVNAASVSLTIGELGQAIAEHYGVKVNEGPSSPTYSFRIDTTLAGKLAGNVRPLSLSDRCTEFAAAYQRNK